MSTAPIKSVPGSRPYWLLVADACLVPALVSAFTAYMNSRSSGRGSADWGAVIFESVEWLFFGALTPIAYVLAYPLGASVCIADPGRHSAASPRADRALDSLQGTVVGL